MQNDGFSDRHLQEQRKIRQLLTSSWSAFFARFGALRPVQLAAIPAILSGKDVLVTAPTAGGKTEAVAAPICERLVSNRWPGLSTLLVTPTRALVNDLFSRLELPVGEMGIQLGRKTSDHAVSRHGSEQFLITTPESLESLLTFNRQRLSDLRAVVIDEIHLLDGSARGDQLRALLGRLRVFLQSVRAAEPLDLQIIALSATIPDVERTASAFLGPHRTIISVSGQRDLDAHVIIAAGDDRQRAESAAIAVSHFPDVQKVLVFVNSRKQVDVTAPHFATAELSEWTVHCHHGSLSKEKREHAEERFKSDRRAICIATMTLEIGIDIGDVDLVICMDPPFSLSSFLQRIGRGCRRLQGKTRVLCVARDRAGELIFNGLIRQAGLGIPAGPTAPFRRSVLVQQFLAYLRQVKRHQRTANQFIRVFQNDTPPVVSEDMIIRMLSDMVDTGLMVEARTIYQPAEAGSEFIESSRIYSNIAPEPAAITLVDADSGMPIASVSGLADRSDGVRLAGRSYHVVSNDGSTRRVREGGQHESAPSYLSRSLPYASDVGISAGASLGFTESQLAGIESGGELIVMTWQGRLVNSCLAEGIKIRGVEARATSFALILPLEQRDCVIGLLQDAAETLEHQNPLEQFPLARVVDVGPHFQFLSPEAQKAARRDWLDLLYIRNWTSGLIDVLKTELDSEIGRDLMALARL